MNYKIMADEARYLKKNPEGVKHMCKIMDDLRIESEMKGMQNGMQKGEENALSLMQKLFALGRVEDAQRATVDHAYCNKLFAEFGMTANL